VELIGGANSGPERGKMREGCVTSNFSLGWEKLFWL